MLLWTDRGFITSEFDNPSQVETPYTVAGLLLTIGYYLQESVLIIYAKQETNFCGQPNRKGIPKVVPLEIVSGVASYHDGLRTAVRVLYRPINQLAGIEPKSH